MDFRPSEQPVRMSAHAVGLTGESRFVRQKTLKTSIRCQGVALHTGATVEMILNPAPAGSGIVFRRTDVSAAVADVPARFDRVVDTRLCSSLGNEAGTVVATVEHLMAAFAGMEIDNALVEIDGPEVPIMDGSSAPFVFLIECAGVVEQDAAREVIRVLKPVTVRQNHSVATLAPADCLTLSFEINFASPAVARQTIHLGLVNGTFRKELARARTFGFIEEVEQLRAAGFARGGSLENAIVVAGDRIMNAEGLRYDDEFVRHKALDAVGDLYLAGAPLIGGFHGDCSGHAINNRLLRALFADPSAYSREPLTVAELAAMTARHHTAVLDAAAE